MAIYNNPALGQAFSNLAAAFAPPSGSDLHGYANAAATREQAQRLAHMYATAQDPNTSWEMLDRLGLGSGQWNPAQSFEGLDRNNATQRYATDVSARTTLATNAADNERALVEAAMRQATDPVAQNAARPGFNPGDWGVAGPEVAPFEGPRSPLTTDQVEARELERLITEGMVTDDMIADNFAGERTPVQAIGEDGSPVFMSPGAAVRGGATPAPTGSPGTPRAYQAPDGSRGTTLDGVTDAHTGEALLPGTIPSTLQDTTETFGSSHVDGVIGDIASARDAVGQLDNAVSAIETYLDRAGEISGAGPDAAVGWLGQAAGSLNSLRAQVGAVVSLAGGDDTVVDTPQGPVSFNEAASSGATQILQELGIQNNEIRAALIDLAYAVARSNKPGDRLNNNDVDNALMQIGGNLGDAAALRATLANVRERAQANYRTFESNRFELYGEELARRGVQPRAQVAPAGGSATPISPSAGAPTIGPQSTPDPSIFAPSGGTPPPSSNPPSPPIEPGTVVDGYRFRGGDPNDETSWEPA